MIGHSMMKTRMLVTPNAWAKPTMMSDRTPPRSAKVSTAAIGRDGRGRDER